MSKMPREMYIKEIKFSSLSEIIILYIIRLEGN